MTTIDLALIVFSATSALRVLAYILQIIRVARDDDGAAAISCTSWCLFAVSHMSTVIYALVTVEDWAMAAIFAVNSGCCLGVVLLTAYKRATFVKSVADQLSAAPAGIPREHASMGTIQASTLSATAIGVWIWPPIQRIWRGSA